MTNLNIRNIDDEAVQSIKRRARLRGLTLGQYIERLEKLHWGLRIDASDRRDTPSRAQARACIELAGLTVPEEEK